MISLRFRGCGGGGNATKPFVASSLPFVNQTRLSVVLACHLFHK